MLEQPGAEPGTTNPSQPGGRPRTTNRVSPWLTGIVGLAVGAAIGLAVGFWPAAAPSGASAADSSTESVSAAVQACQLTGSTGITLMDEGNSVELQTAGKKSTGAPYADVVCVLDELNAPESVKARMDTTRALDGSQNATWTGYSAVWTYHPDNGLNIIVETQETP